MTSTYDKVIALVSSLTYSELEGVQIVVNHVLSQGRMPAEGHVEYRYIKRSGKDYGPYKYRRIWQQGKLKDVYEGKASQDEYQTWLTQKAQRQLKNK